MTYEPPWLKSLALDNAYPKEEWFQPKTIEIRHENVFTTDFNDSTRRPVPTNGCPMVRLT